jgi:hypothetical protein
VVAGGSDRTGGARAQQGTARIRTLPPRRIDGEQGTSWPPATQIKRAKQGAARRRPHPPPPPGARPPRRRAPLLSPPILAGVATTPRPAGAAQETRRGVRDPHAQEPDVVLNYDKAAFRLRGDAARSTPPSMPSLPPSSRASPTHRRRGAAGGGGWRGGSAEEGGVVGRGKEEECGGGDGPAAKERSAAGAACRGRGRGMGHGAQAAGRVDWRRGIDEEREMSFTPCSFGLSAISQQYFSLTTNHPSATSQQYFSLTTNQHQPSATSQTNRLLVPFSWVRGD